MAVAQQEIQGLALERRTIPNAFNHEGPFVPLRDANHHVIDQGAGESLESALLLFFGGPCYHDLAVVDFDADLRLKALLQLALRAGNGQRTALELARDPAGNGHGKISYSRHDLLSFHLQPLLEGAVQFIIMRLPARARGYHTSHNTSPPTFELRACLPVITPCDVLRMEMPSPLQTGLISPLPT